jgi:hypothetical protein
MWNKIKKTILILNVVINVILGIIILQISKSIYRYHRLGAWTQQNEYYNQFYKEMQDMILLACLIWGALIILSIVLFIFEIRKKS